MYFNRFRRQKWLIQVFLYLFGNIYIFKEHKLFRNSKFSFWWHKSQHFDKETPAVCGVSFENTARVQCYVGFKVCWPGCTGSGHLMPPVKQRPRSIILPLESPGSTVVHFSPYLWQSHQISFVKSANFLILDKNFSTFVLNEDFKRSSLKFRFSEKKITRNFCGFLRKPELIFVHGLT